MSKKELWKKISRNQARERARHDNAWIIDNLRELSSYIETGELDWLRERCLHSIRHLIRWARLRDSDFIVPWFVYCY